MTKQMKDQTKNFPTLKANQNVMKSMLRSSKRFNNTL